MEVDDHVNKITTTELISGFNPHFKTTSKIGAGMIRPGDTLGLTIWENVDDQLFGRLGRTALQTIQVDGEGYILCPMPVVLKPLEIPPKRLGI